MNYKDLLPKVEAMQELLKDPAHWTKGDSAKSVTGMPVNPTSPLAACWCLSGAVEKIADDAVEYRRALINLVRLATRRRGANFVFTWNDARERTHAEVMQLLEEVKQECQNADA